LLTTADRVELIDGWIVEKPVKNPPHVAVLNRLRKRLTKLASDTVEIRYQDPITLPTSEPEPDAVIAVGPEERYVEAHPTPKDIHLVVEVSDSTLDMDRGPKRLIYAAARIPIYWLVSIPDERVEVYSDPRAGRKPIYRTRRDYGRGTNVPVVINGATLGEIAVDDILPQS
jgi:hypothetical protein